MEASLSTTFRACSSPAPTLVKPQPAPTILCLESVHTTLSITHHTRKRPSTGPLTTQVLNLPLDECIDNTHILVTKEKRKRNSTFHPKSAIPTMLTSLLPSEGFHEFSKIKFTATSIRQKTFSMFSHVAHLKWLS
jgi:hypothetical protein